VCAATAWLCVVGCGDHGASDALLHPSDTPSSAASANAAGHSAAQPPLRCAPAPHDVEVWRRSIAGGAVLEPTSVAADSEGNAFVARATGETVKISDTGALLWSKPFGALVAAAPDGGAIVAGTFTGTISLGETRLTAAGGTDVYVAELAEDGRLLFGVALGGPKDEEASGLAAGPDGNAVVSGPGLGTVSLDRDGNPRWRRDFFGAVAIDAAANVLLTGALTSARSFGGETLVSAGGEDIFVVKLDGLGRHRFSLRFGDVGPSQHGEAVASDRAGNVFVSGVLDGAVDFGGGALSVPKGACPAESWCEQAGFILKLDPSGAHLWSRSRAPVRSMPGLAADSRGHVIASGAYPGDAPPYRTVLLLELDENGNDLGLSPRLDASLTDAGSGYRLAIDGCDHALWSLGVPSEPGASASATSLLAKLAP
jgi:hypothetical protein